MRPRKDSSRYEHTSHINIKRDKRSGKYFFRGTVNDKVIDKALKTRSFTEATRKATGIIAIAMGAGEVATQNHSFDEAFDIVLKLQKAKSDKTHVMARTQIEGHLRPWFKQHCPLLHTFERGYEEIWAEYKITQKELNPGRKLEHDKRHLRMALIRAQNKGWIKAPKSGSWSTALELKEATEPVGKYIEPDDMTLILATLRPENITQKARGRIYLQALMACTMALRKTEIMHLAKDEIDSRRREINLDPHRLKIRRPRKVAIPITDEVYPLLMAAVTEAPGKYVFPKWLTNEPGQPIVPNEPQDDNRYYWDWVREQLGIEVRWHDMRHTAITNMLASGLPETFVAQVTGATAETIRRIYAHLNQDLKARFRALRVCGMNVENGEIGGNSAEKGLH